MIERPAFGDIDDAGVEIAVLAGDALVDRIGDDVGDAAPVLLRRGVAQAGELLLGENVPQPELDREAAVGLRRDVAGDQRLRVQDAPIGVVRRRARRRVLIDEGALIERLEQARAFEIRRQHLRDVMAHLRALVRAGEIRNRDRHGLHLAVGDVEMKLGARRGRGERDTERDQGGERNGGEANHPAMSLGSKVMVKICHSLYLSSGSLSGVHCGLKNARRAESAAARKLGSP